MKIRTIALPTLLSLVTMAAANAQAHPNFSGTWVLDSAKSKMTSPMTDQVPQLSGATWIIAQHGDTMIVDRETVMGGAPGVKSHVVMGTDGKPWKNTVPSGGAMVETSSVLSWEGAVLITQTSGSIQGQDFTQTDHLSLTADGKGMVSKRVVTLPDGTEVQSATLTFTKKS